MRWSSWILGVWLTATLSATGTLAPADTRWSSTDGRSFEGIYLGTDPASSKALFAGPAGTRLAVDPQKLTAASRKRIDELDRSGQATLHAAAVRPFRPAPAPDRSKLPRLNQGEFGKLASDCVPNVLSSFLLWWDQTGGLPVPHRGDPRAKAEWLHQQLSGYCATTDDNGTSTRNTHLGLQSYFREHLADTAVLQVGTDYDCSPANLARYPVGPAACLLDTTVYYGDQQQGGHVVALISARPDGLLTFRTWGLDFQAKLRVLERRPGSLRRGMGQVPDVVQALDLTETTAARLPAWFRQLGIRFRVDPAEWDGITVAVPYLYQQAPGTAPPPPDPLFEGIFTLAREAPRDPRGTFPNGPR